MRLTPLALTAMVVALIAAGCSSGEVADVASTTPPAMVASPSPTPTPGIVLWAGQVCVARDAVIGAVIVLGKNLSFDPGSGLSASDQFQTQLNGQMGGINAAMENLGTVLGEVPVDYVEASALVSTLNASGDLVIKGRDETMRQLNAVSQAGDPLTMAAALVQAGIAAKATFDAGQVFVSELNSGTDSTRGELGKAFAASPLCQ